MNELEEPGDGGESAESSPKPSRGGGLRWQALGAVGAVVAAAVLLLTYLGCQPVAQVTLHNSLLDPVAVTINDKDRGHLAAGATQAYSIDAPVSIIDWRLVGRQLSSGKPLGDDMAGRFVNVERGQALTIRPRTGPADGMVTYFTPVIANRSDRGCDVGIDAANATDRRLGVNLGRGDVTRFGYFRFDGGMHVFVDCGGRILSWDLDPLRTIADGVASVGDPETGKLALAFDNRFEASPSPGGPTLPPTPIPTSPPQGCSAPASVSWENHEPIFDLSIRPSAGPCQTIMISSASFSVPNGPSCAEGNTVVCVVVARVEEGSTAFPIDGLGGASWYGLTQSSIDAAINDKVTDPRLGWFSPANCGRATGCSKAVIYARGPDGTYERRDINHP